MKGFWIDADDFLDADLKIMDKLMLTAIKQLSKTEKGCYASNNYFADFFDITASRCSQIITKLSNLGYINVEFEREGKIITKRIIMVVNKLNRVVRKLKRGSKYSKEGYLIYCEGNNKTNNNKEDNNKEYIPPTHGFDEWWKLYPRKIDKSKAEAKWISKQLSKKSDTLIEKLKDQIANCKSMNSGKEYIKHPTTYLNAGSFDNEIEPIQERSNGNNSQRRETTGERINREINEAINMAMVDDESQVPEFVGGKERLKLLR